MKHEIADDELEYAYHIFANNPGINNREATDILYDLLHNQRSWYGCYHIIRVVSHRLKGEALARIVK